MAVIEKIRQRSGIVLIIIGLALVSFLLSDAISNNSGLFRSDNTKVGVIDGTKVSYEEFNKRSELLEENYMKQTGQTSIDENFRGLIRDQVWNELIQEKVVNPQYASLGLEATDDELFYIITQNPVDFPQIMNSFKNQQTQQFDPSAVVGYLKQLDMEGNEENKKQWDNYVSTVIVPQTIMKKYNTLVSKGVFRTSLEAKEEYNAAATQVNAKYAGFNYNNVPDTAVKVEESDMRQYLKDHKDDFKQESSRKIEYVVFNLTPSEEDTASAKKWADEVFSQFQSTKNDTLFIENNGDSYLDTTYKSRGNFPANVEEQLFTAETGSVVGPVYDKGTYSLYKVLGSRNDTVEYIKASQILVKPRGFTKEDSLYAVTRANAIAAELRKGKDFNQMAIDSSEDYGTRSQGGDLGWFARGKGKLPDAVERPVFATSKDGIVVVRSAAGVHVIKVTENKSSKLICVGTLGKSVEVGRNTESAVYNMANEFAGQSRDAKSFDENADKMKFAKRISPDLKEQDRELPAIPEAREVIRWAYNEEVNPGDISGVMTAGDKYIVAKLTSIKEKGTAKFEDVKDRLELETRKEKKAEYIREKLKAVMSDSKTIEQIAGELNLIVNNAPNQSFANVSLPYIGADMEVLGAMFGSEPKKMVGPVKGSTGVYLVYVDGVTQGEMPGDITPVRMRIASEFNNSASGRAFEALKKSSEIEDFRFRFY